MHLSGASRRLGSFPIFEQFLYPSLFTGDAWGGAEPLAGSYRQPPTRTSFVSGIFLYKFCIATSGPFLLPMEKAIVTPSVACNAKRIGLQCLKPRLRRSLSLEGRCC